MANVWINEFHYDNGGPNNGADVNEFIEIAGLAGTDLTGWKIQHTTKGIVACTVTRTCTAAPQITIRVRTTDGRLLCLAATRIEQIRASPKLPCNRIARRAG